MKIRRRLVIVSSSESSVEEATEVSKVDSSDYEESNYRSEVDEVPPLSPPPPTRKEEPPKSVNRLPYFLPLLFFIVIISKNVEKHVRKTSFPHNPSFILWIPLNQVYRVKVIVGVTQVPKGL